MTSSAETLRARITSAYRDREQDLFVRTDRMFAVLMATQWFAGIVAAMVISPRTWSGIEASSHPHLWAAVLLGGALALYPIYLVVTRPGHKLTRHSIAIAQMLFSGLLIHLMGGRIETHFHVFGSLAFLAFYRERSVLLVASAVVVIDHLARGIFWPESIYGVLSAPLWRSFEHAGWVLFELTFLLIATKQGRKEMWTICDRQARIETAHEEVERKVEARTQDLRAAEQRTRAILDTAADGIITIDDGGIVQSLNPAAERIFGYPAAEVIGRNVAMLMPPPYAEAHDGYLRSYLETGERKVIGVGREVTGRRQDGSTFPLDLAVSESQGGVFTGIVRDITERKSVDQMKTEFISTVSHELRTPLTSIRGSLGLLSGGVAGSMDEKAASLIGIAANNCDRLVRLVNDILDIEKIESGKMDLRLESHQLSKIVEEAIEATKQFALGYCQGIVLEQTADDTGVVVDRDRIVQVLTNLISNAAKFSPETEKVHVAIHRDQNTLRVEIEDHGPGIPAKFQPVIFSKFAQADSSDVRQKGGTGLGLSISKAIVEMHGGRIGFRTVEGSGTTFHFSLAARPTPVAPAPDPVIAAENGGPRVLVCEDDPDIAHLLTLMLQQAGASVAVAHDADEARSLLASEEFTAMTLDLGLPGESGMDLLRCLRSQPATADLPVVVVSAQANEGRQQFDREALGVVTWLNKPIDQNQLLSSIQAAVGRRQPSDGEDRPPRVLHVEDNDDLASIVAETLRPVVDMERARDLGEAQRMLGDSPFDVVLIDLDLPDGNGLDLVPLLGRGARSIPAVIFSASEPTNEIASTVAASLVKSRTTNEELIEVITSLVRSHTAATAVAAHPEESGD